MQNVILSPVAVPDLVDMIANEVIARMGQTAPPPQEQDEELTISQLADRLNCSKVTIHKYRKQGLPSYQIGRKVLFSWQEVLDFMGQKKKRKTK